MTQTLSDALWTVWLLVVAAAYLGAQLIDAVKLAGAVLGG